MWSGFELNVTELCCYPIEDQAKFLRKKVKTLPE